MRVRKVKIRYSNRSTERRPLSVTFKNFARHFEDERDRRSSTTIPDPSLSRGPCANQSRRDLEKISFAQPRFTLTLDREKLGRWYSSNVEAFLESEKSHFLRRGEGEELARVLHLAVCPVRRVSRSPDLSGEHGTVDIFQRTLPRRGQ